MSYSTLEEFEYAEPASLDEALALTARYPDSARVIAGGTDLVVLMMKRKIAPPRLVNISKIRELNFIRHDDEAGLSFGAATTLRSIERSAVVRERYPILFDAVRVIGSIQIRNMATVGGNLCNASPAADTAPPLLALDASVVAAHQGGQREVPLDGFFLGPGKTALQPGELLTEVRVRAAPGARMAFTKLGRTPTDISKVSAGVLLESQRRTCLKARIALGAVGPTPIRAKKAEALLEGKEIDARLIDQAAEEASREAKPIDDTRSTARWRSQAVKYLVKTSLQRTSGVP